MHADANQGRRAEDRDSMSVERFDRLESEQHQMVVKMTSIEGSMRATALEQGHLKELLTARLSLIERTQELGNAKFDQLSRTIQEIASEPEKTPMGRQMLQDIRGLTATIEQQNDKMAVFERAQESHDKWRTQIETVIGILKWVGAGGLLALLLAILRLLKVIP